MFKLKPLMYKRILLILLAPLALFSCKKKKEETCGYKGTIYFQCLPEATLTYTGYIDGVAVQDFTPGGIGIFTRDTGYHILHVKPSTVWDTVYLSPCGTVTYTFPL